MTKLTNTFLSNLKTVATCEILFENIGINLPVYNYYFVEYKYNTIVENNIDAVYMLLILKLTKPRYKKEMITIYG
jgi:hypothetical protein